MPLWSRWECFVVTLTLLVLWLTGCAHLSPPPCEMQPLPKPPALNEPLPSVSYTRQAQLDDENSQKRLTGMSLTSKPVAPAGLSR